MSIIWRNEMSVDGGVIDHDHQTLIAIINEFCDAPHDAHTVENLRAILAKLQHYAELHFKREEALQNAAQYPFREAHQHEHHELICQLEKVRSELSALTGPSPEEVAETASGSGTPAAHTAPAQPEIFVGQVHAELAELLHHWLIDHVIKSDLRLKPYVAQMASHAKTLRPITHVSM